jgi:hypothetical protein
MTDQATVFDAQKKLLAQLATTNGVGPIAISAGANGAPILRVSLFLPEVATTIPKTIDGFEIQVEMVPSIKAF